MGFQINTSWSVQTADMLYPGISHTRAGARALSPSHIRAQILLTLGISSRGEHGNGLTRSHLGGVTGNRLCHGPGAEAD